MHKTGEPPAKMRQLYFLTIKMADRGIGQSQIREDELKEFFLGIMEGYNDSAIPPLSYFSTPEDIPNNNEQKSSNSRGKQKVESEKANKVRKECRRRSLLTDNFTRLQSMVPSLVEAYKPSKEKIIVDTVDYIKYLKAEAERLEGMKKSQRKLQNVKRTRTLTKCTNPCDTVNVTITDSTAFLVVQLPSRHGSVLAILKVLEKHEAEILEARINVSDEKMMTFTATVSFGRDGGSSIDKVRQDILTSLEFFC